MIFGIGTDIVRVARMQQDLDRFGERFAERILTENEMQEFRRNAGKANFLARRFAAKEAAVKALGTGFSGGITFQDIEIRSDALGKPLISFHNQARLRFEALGGRTAHITLSHSRENAVAMVILEG